MSLVPQLVSWEWEVQLVSSRDPPASATHPQQLGPLYLVEEVGLSEALGPTAGQGSAGNLAKVPSGGDSPMDPGLVLSGASVVKPLVDLNCA